MKIEQLWKEYRENSPYLKEQTKEAILFLTIFIFVTTIYLIFCILGKNQYSYQENFWIFLGIVTASLVYPLCRSVMRYIDTFFEEDSAKKRKNQTLISQLLVKYKVKNQEFLLYHNAYYLAKEKERKRFLKILDLAIASIFLFAFIMANNIDRINSYGLTIFLLFVWLLIYLFTKELRTAYEIIINIISQRDNHSYRQSFQESLYDIIEEENC